ncbi:phenylalanine--tRNA ligase subunit alpha [Candidatus Micrarchaeota archaeon]|nr:phenylalanine--tRNA ligase subunit alpha [Candidatus Micrarchaeota archaeon]
MYKGTDKVLRLLISARRTVGEISREAGLNEDSVRRIAEALKAEGYVTIETSESLAGIPTAELEKYAGSVFPETAVYRKALAGASVSDLSAEEKSIGIRWARVKGFIAIDAGKLVPEKGEDEVAEETRRMMEAYAQLSRTGRCADAEIFEELFERRLLSRKMEKTSTVIYSGKKVDWSLFDDKFDVNVPGPNARVGKNHPVTKLTNHLRTIMSELGFQEMEGDIIESSFWNFDALFQPQDHPARELADTFYIKGESPLPEDEKLVLRVKKAHEDGWKCRWDPKEASKTVLRTHTTAVSARYVAAITDKKPRKYFSIGRVFRNEATDYKHLAEFHQVEGIIAWEGATFTDLLGVLKEIYGKLGFEKIRFRPSFFPYTEPSLEIEVYFEERKQWMELGGAGIFRPEVSIPLAGVYPVLAWGLSLERPLMLKLELDDIRDLYRNDVDFLTSARLDL